jgi:monoamine oxidase
MSPPERTSVAIVGAGITGLRSARLLVDAGVDCVVLEARERVGGRLLSLPVQPGEEDGADAGRDGEAGLDLGATWFWPNEPRVAALVRELGLPVHAQHLEGDALYDDPRGIQRLSGNPLDGPAGRFTPGADSLARAIADSLPPGVVHLGAPVDEVAVEEQGVHLSGPGVRVTADQAVLALPPSLAAARIRFRPALPGQLAALAAATPVWMGATAKVVVEYARPFWREQGLAGSGVSHVGPLREIHDMSGPAGSPAALFGFASSANTPTGSLTEPEVVAQLTRMFGAEAADPLRVVIQDWRQEAWTSPPGVELQQRYELYGHPLFRDAIHGRIHLASTETAQAFAGHIEGALVAAEEVAARIARRAPSGHAPGA